MKLRVCGALSLVAIAALAACGGGSDASSPGAMPGASAQADSGTPAVPQKPNQVFSVKVSYATYDEFQAAMEVVDHANVDKEPGTISAEIDSPQMEALQKLGLSVRIDEAETARIRKFVVAAAPGDDPDKLEKISDGSDDHACYRTVLSIYKQFDALKAKYPDLVRVVPVGKTFMGNQFDAKDSTRSTFAKLMAKFLPASMLNTSSMASLLGLNTFDPKLLPTEPPPIKALVVGNFKKQDAQTQKPPSYVMTGGIHAREYAPQEVAMKYMEWLLENYETDPNARMMVDSNRYHFIVHNPDGRQIAEQQTTASHRKNANYKDAACRSTSWSAGSHGGVDLNRNYPFNWAKGGPGAKDDICEQTTRGPSVASEPETQAVLGYVRGTWNQSACKWEGGALPDGRPKSATYCNAENRSANGKGDFDMNTPADVNYDGGVYMDLHAYGEMILWPWGLQTVGDTPAAAPNAKELSVLAQRLAHHNKNEAIHFLYDASGLTIDAVYGFLGTPSYTIEMGTSFYQSCKSFSDTLMPNNHRGMHYVSRILRRPYQLAQGPDTTDVTIASAAVPPGEGVAIKATVNDNSYVYSVPKEDKRPVGHTIPKPVVKNIKSAMAYIDKLPWEAGAVGIPLTLSDSAKANRTQPKATQTASGTLATAGLAPGRHMVYVQGINDDGKAGSVSAAFLNIK